MTENNPRNISLTNNETIHWKKLISILLVIVMLGCYVGVRIYRIDEESIWLDENRTWIDLELPSFRDYLGQLRIYDATFVPAYYFLLYYWEILTHHSIIAARLLSLVFSLVTAFFVFFMALNTYGFLAALTTLAMLTLSNVHIYYSQEIRVYALYCMATMLSIWSLQQALQKSRKSLWALHQAANILLVFSHYFGALFLFAEGIWLLIFHRKSIKRLVIWFAAQSVTAVLLIMWMKGIKGDVLISSIEFLKAPQVGHVEYIFTWAALYFPRSLYAYLWIARIGVLMIALLILLGMIRRRKSEQDRKRYQSTILYLLTLLVPLILILLSSFFVQPALSLRYVLPASLIFFILIGGALETLLCRPIRWIALLLLVVLLSAQYLEEQRPFRPATKRAGELLAQFNSGNNALVSSLDPNIQRLYIKYPEKDVYPYQGQEAFPKFAESLLDRYQNVLLLFEYRYLDQPFYTQLEKEIRNQGLSLKRIKVSSEHRTFLSTWIWPAPFDEAISITIYQVTHLQ